MDVGAADLERSRALQVLRLEEHLASREPTKGGRALERCRADDTGEPARRVFDLGRADERRSLTAPDGHRSPVGQVVAQERPVRDRPFSSGA